MARIPEDRHAVGVVGDLPVWENAVSERLRSHWFAHPWFRAFWVKRGAARQHAERVAKTFDVRGGGPDAPARSLSGGNMQKLILGRALMPPQNGAGNTAPAPQLIVAHQPTWGLDIGAVMFVQQQLINARDSGAAVLLISDDLDEVLALGDREYTQFCAFGHQLDDWLRRQGATSLFDLVEVDNADDSALRHWQQVAGADALRLHWLVVSPRMRDAALQAGATVTLSSGADTPSLRAALQQLREQLAI